MNVLNEKELGWHVATSEFAHTGHTGRTGLGWPSDQQLAGDRVPPSELGWPPSGRKIDLDTGGGSELEPARLPESARPEGALPETARLESAPLESARLKSALPESALPETGRLESALPESALPESALPDQAPVDIPPLGAPLTDTARPMTVPSDATPMTDTVSRETANQGGPVENASEREPATSFMDSDLDLDTPLARAVALDAQRRTSLTGKIFPKPDRTRILTVANQKGGVGKTTTAVNIAAGLAQSGLRVLVVDIDPQGNASTALGIDHHADVPSIYDVLVDGKPIVDVVQECSTIPNLWCVPATIDLAGAEIELVSLVARETRMEKALTAYIAGAGERGEERMDYVLIDCPPSLGLLTVNAFVAADEVFIPIQCEYYALEGLSQLLKNIELIKSHLNPGLHVSTILLTMYDGRTRLSAQVAEEVRSHFPEQVLRTSVPRSVRISEAPSFGQTVMTYDPHSSGALSYLEAAGELAERGVSR
jgi:chromosome partitioning protein